MCISPYTTSSILQKTERHQKLTKHPLHESILNSSDIHRLTVTHQMIILRAAAANTRDNPLWSVSSAVLGLRSDDTCRRPSSHIRQRRRRRPCGHCERRSVINTCHSLITSVKAGGAMFRHDQRFYWSQPTSNRHV